VNIPDRRSGHDEPKVDVIEVRLRQKRPTTNIGGGDERDAFPYECFPHTRARLWRAGDHQTLHSHEGTCARSLRVVGRTASAEHAVGIGPVPSKCQAPVPASTGGPGPRCNVVSVSTKTTPTPLTISTSSSLGFDRGIDCPRSGQ
jgi:hypothetical protein